MHSAAPPLRFHRGDWKAAAFALFLTGLLAGLTLLDVYGDRIMKRCFAAGAVLALAFVLSACATTLPEGQVAAAAGGNVEVLKEVNRHLETCDRTYSWPFSVMIVCKAQTATPDLQTQIQKGVEAAFARILANQAVTSATQAAPAQ